MINTPNKKKNDKILMKKTPKKEGKNKKEWWKKF